MAPATYLILAGLSVVGLWIFARGRRGRAIDDHPVCSRCKFDLTGRPPGSRRNCPECGGYLGAPLSVDRGNCERRTGLMWAGLTAMLLGGLPLVSMIGLWVTHVDASCFKPVWWLLRDAAANPAGNPSRDAAELNARVQADRLSLAQDKDVTAAALRLQADLNRRWNPLWGDMVEAMHRRGQVSAADWLTYLSHDEPATMEVRPACAYGDPVPIHISGELRGATPLATPRPGPWGFGVQGIVPGAVTAHPDWSASLGTGFDVTGCVDLTRASFDHLRPGTQSVLVTVTGLGSAMAATPALFPSLRRQGIWTLLDKGQSSVRLYRDEAMAARVAKAMTVSVRVDPDATVNVAIVVDHTPADLALDMVLRAGNTELSSGGWIVINRNQWPNAGNCTFTNAAGLIGRRVDVLLRPSVRAAVRTVHMDKLLDHEFAIKDVAIPAGR